MIIYHYVVLFINNIAMKWNENKEKNKIILNVFCFSNGVCLSSHFQFTNFFS